MKTLERNLKALANKKRLAIIKHLKSNKQVSVGEIASAINLSLKSTSRHLIILTNAEMVEKKQIKLRVFYRLPSKSQPTLKHILKLV